MHLNDATYVKAFFDSENECQHDIVNLDHKTFYGRN